MRNASPVLGRFRRASELTPTGLGGAIARWEKFYLNLFPSGEPLEAIARGMRYVVRVEGDCIDKNIQIRIKVFLMIE
ncbi:hypothetical protein [Microcoleus sp. A003_D6]|uniref:hypothetical protein n=1 Tax=Microcoleus sp. A003_D6 TaxID=3055266 RepID=UPI002FD10A09